MTCQCVSMCLKNVAAGCSCSLSLFMGNKRTSTRSWCAARSFLSLSLCRAHHQQVLLSAARQVLPFFLYFGCWLLFLFRCTEQPFSPVGDSPASSAPVDRARKLDMMTICCSWTVRFFCLFVVFISFPRWLRSCVRVCVRR